jgi:hypothetical protein
VGAEAEGLDHVRVTPNASIHQDLDLTMHRGDRQAGDYSGEDNGGGAAVFWRQLAAIVIPEKGKPSWPCLINASRLSRQPLSRFP